MNLCEGKSRASSSRASAGEEKKKAAPEGAAENLAMLRKDCSGQTPAGA